ATGGSGAGGAPGTETKGGESNCDEGDGGPGFGGAGGTYDRCGYFGYGGGGGGGGGLFGGAGGVFSSAGEGGGGGSSGFAPGVATNTSIETDSTGAPAIAFSFTPSPASAPTTGAPAVTLPPPAAAPEVKCLVPRLGGRKLKGVRKGLGKAHCKLGKVRRKERGAKHVVTQSPKPGTTLPAGSKVNVTLGS
ncbi:MAG TPA: PASTA domain-containing protein, partial [Solirubrobacterales bacterium]|nr:PASTA domain-containing protein [Solirubrobacterales bacterium]